MVRMLNLSKSLGSQLNHVAVVEEFLIHLRQNFLPDAVCLLLPEMLENGPTLIRDRVSGSNDSLRFFVTKLCERSMQLGRSFISIHSVKQSAINGSRFPNGFPYSIMAVPLELPQKRIGVITTVRDEKNTLYCEQDLQLLGVFASHTASALQNSHLYSRLRTMNQDVIRSFAQAVRLRILRAFRSAWPNMPAGWGRTLGWGPRA